MDYDKLYSDKNVPKSTRDSEVTIPDLPDTQEIRDLARIVMPDAFKVLYKLMMSEETPPAIKKSCAETLIDRGYGKAAQAMEVTGKIQFEQLIIQRSVPKSEQPIIDVETNVT